MRKEDDRNEKTRVQPDPDASEDHKNAGITRRAIKEVQSQNDSTPEDEGDIDR
jgi:hypothetical protein